MKKFLIVIFIFFFSFNYASAQKEGDLSMSPSVVDASAAPRATLDYSIKLSNSAPYKLNIFPLVEDLEEDGTVNNKSLLDRQYKMSEWISIKRGSVEIMPNGEISLPLKIDIPGDAIPGDYFVSIAFAFGPNRTAATENSLKLSPPKLFVNLKVDDQSVEKASILKYLPTKKFFISSLPTLSFDLNNSGNVDLIPRGNIYLYNKRQQEVDSIAINQNATMAPSGKITNFKITANKKLKTGKYKARLEIEYGNKTSKETTDTVYFIVITLPFLLFFGFGIFIFIILLSLIIFRKTYHHKSDRNHHEKIEKISVKKNEKGDVINLKSKE